MFFLLLFLNGAGVHAQLPEGEVILHRNQHFLKLTVPPLLNDTIKQLVVFNAQGKALHRFILGPTERPLFVPFPFPLPGLYCFLWETSADRKFVQLLHAEP